MATWTCIDHGKDLKGIQQTIEHVRRYHASFIRRPGRLGDFDTHGHMWYCFDCESRTLNDHRSYDSDRAMWNHLQQSHTTVVDCIMDSFNFSHKEFVQF